MEKTWTSGRTRRRTLQVAAVMGALLAVFSGHAAGTNRQGEARHQPVSFNGDAPQASDASPAATPARADLQRMFKARCPGRVERLLGVALPSERPDFKVIADICTCATASVDGLPEGTPIDQFQIQAAQAALACSKTTITAHNQLRTTKVLGPYLSAQGLSAQQVSTFSQCVADTHWKNTVDTAGNAGRPGGNTWWNTCTEQVGRKGLAQPQD